MSHQNFSADEPTARAHSHPTSGRRVSFEDLTCSRCSAQSMPAAMSGKPRRRSSVSWNTMIDVRIIPARACAQDDCQQPLKEAKRSGTVEDDTCAHAPPMPATSGITRCHSWPRSVSWDTNVNVIIIPARERVTLEDKPGKTKRHTVMRPKRA
ncbi:hypothetical protein T484DRAFT_2021594 [Baffinella frigidus]|nr:hypothetical protein T484DRAFT_2021594 [Cryptophyta sp. CCMP2293]